MLSFTRPSVQTELDRFYKALSNSSESFEPISKSAFTQARRKLNPLAFKELSQSQLDYFNKNAPFKKDWKDKRVVAIDTTLLNLPHTEDVKQEFGLTKNQFEEVVNGLGSFAYDVCNELILDAVIDRRDRGEKDIVLDHLKHLNPATDILVFDRGYPCHWLMGLLDKKGFKFCFRLSSSWKQAYNYMDGYQDREWILKKPPKEAWGKLRTFGLTGKIDLRLINITLSSGEQEILATNLTDKESYSLKELEALYHLRWGVEESFKSFKKALHIEYFTGRTALAVKQDFYAKVFMLNMASMIRTQGVQDRKNSKSGRIYRANKTQTLAKLKDFLINLFNGKHLKKIIRQMLKILKRRLEIFRPGRSFVRTKASSLRRRQKIATSKGI